MLAHYHQTTFSLVHTFALSPLPVSVLQFANPQGNEPHLDPASLSRVWFMPSLHPGKELEEAQHLVEDMKKTNNFSKPTKCQDINDDMLGQLDGIFMPGGVCVCATSTCSIDMSRHAVVAICFVEDCVACFDIGCTWLGNTTVSATKGICIHGKRSTCKHVLPWFFQSPCNCVIYC